MNKIKKFVPVIFLMILAAIVLFTVNNGKPLNYDTSELQTGRNQPYNSNDNENQTIALSQSNSDTNIKNNSSHEKFFYFNLASFSLTGEKIDNFFSLIYDEINKSFKITHIDNEPTDYIDVYAKDYFSSDSTMYNLLKDDSIIYKYVGTHSPFHEKITYINYIVDTSRQPKQEWINGFKNIVFTEVGQFNSPIIVKESWSIKYNNAEIDIVNFCNYIPDSSIPLYSDDFCSLKELENIPLGNSVLYNEYIVFYNNDVTPFLINNVKTSCLDIDLISSKPLDKENFLSFKLPEKENKDMFYNIAAWTYQYDNEYNIIKSAVFGPSYYFQLDEIEYEYCFLDIDNDGSLEIINHREGNGVNNIISIYKYDTVTDTIKYVVSF